MTRSKGIVEEREKRARRVRGLKKAVKTGGKPSRTVYSLRRQYGEVRSLLRGMLGGSRADKAEEYHSEVLGLLDRLNVETKDSVGVESDSGFSRKRLARSIKDGIELAMMMHAYKRCGVGSIAAFYYLLGEQDFRLLGQLGTKLIPRDRNEAFLSQRVTYAQQINIKPFVGGGGVGGVESIEVKGVEVCGLVEVREAELVGDWCFRDDED